MKKIGIPEETESPEIIADFGETFGQLTRQKVKDEERRSEDGPVKSEARNFEPGGEVTS